MPTSSHPASPPPRLSVRPGSGIIALGLFAAYALSFHTLFDLVGPSVGVFQAVPVLFAAWVGGQRWGLGMGLVAGTVGFPLYATAMPGMGLAEHLMGSVPPLVIFGLLGFGLGRMRELGAALRHERARYRSIIESVHDVIARTDAEGRWVFLSPSWETLTGFTVAESLGRSYAEFLHPEDRPQNDVAFEALLGEHPAAVRVPCRYRTRGGGYRHTEVHVRLVMENGEPVGTTGIITDVTDARRFEAEREARQRAEEMVRAKNAFLNNMSHEVRTPLTSIIGFADVLASEVAPEQEEFVQHIRASSYRLLGTLNGLLELAQLEGSGLSLRSEPLDVTAEAEAVVEELRPLAAQKGLAFHVERQAAPTAVLDRAGLRRVLSQLTENALKFTECGGVTVCVGEAEGQAVVAVCDTGPGISDAFFPHLFEAFEQESTGLARAHEGSGLGLTIAQHLAEQMGGSVTATTVLGTGSCFTARFPLAPGGDAPRRADEACAPSRVL
jgi:PAS domain S-box-containing protein